MESRTEAVEALARSPLLLEGVERLLSRAAAMEDPAALGETPESRALADVLSRVLTLGFHGSVVLRDDGLTLADAMGDMVGRRVTDEGVEALARVFAEGTVLSHPFRSRLAVEDEDGARRVGVPIMFVATPLPVPGPRRAALALLVRPKEDFTRLLGTARAGETGDVVAFDREGLLLSRSRFDDALRACGLLPPDPRVESLLQVRVLDPGGATPPRPPPGDPIHAPAQRPRHAARRAPRRGSRSLASVVRSPEGMDRSRPARGSRRFASDQRPTRSGQSAGSFFTRV